MRILKKIVLFFVQEVWGWILCIVALVGMVAIGEWSGGNWLLGLFLGFIFIGLYCIVVLRVSRELEEENEASDRD